MRRKSNHFFKRKNVHDELQDEVKQSLDVWTILKENYKAMTQTWPIPTA